MTKIEMGWWVPQLGGSRPRWVLAVSDTHVLYSNGRTHHECLHKTFRDWVRTYGARLGVAPEFSMEAA